LPKEKQKEIREFVLPEKKMYQIQNSKLARTFKKERNQNLPVTPPTFSIILVRTHVFRAFSKQVLAREKKL
jgi:hypothetical protein